MIITPTDVQLTINDSRRVAALKSARELLGDTAQPAALIAVAEWIAQPLPELITVDGPLTAHEAQRIKDQFEHKIKTSGQTAA